MLLGTMRFEPAYIMNARSQEAHHNCAHSHQWSIIHPPEKVAVLIAVLSEPNNQGVTQGCSVL